MAHTVLIVDDEPTQVRVLEKAVTRHGYNVLTASNGEDAVRMLLSGDTTPPGTAIDVLLLDLSMPKMSGIEVMEAVRPKLPQLPILILTAHGSVSNVVECMRAGANDFIAKPASAERINTAISNALKAESAVGDIEPVREAMTTGFGFEDLVGDSPAIQDAIEVARKAAKTSLPVLIEGESGVGKELFSRAIQSVSERATKPFVTVNCGAIPENLVESILFGHEKGAFTGANERHIGKFEEANDGTLFLDEIGELTPDIQVKLLRALQEGEIDPVGARQPVQVDIRLISATNRNLAERVAEGMFREDLFYRLNVFPMRVPPLRRRRDDIPDLVEHFIQRVGEAENIAPRTVSPDAMTLLVNHNWPGNIRQLQNAVFRAVVLCEHDELKPEDFPQILAQARKRAFDAGADAAAISGPLVSSSADATNGQGAAATMDPSMSGLLPVLKADGQLKALSRLEKEIIQIAIKKYNGRMSEVARRLGIGRSTLYRKIADYNLDKRTGDVIGGGDDSEGESGKLSA